MTVGAWPAYADDHKDVAPGLVTRMFRLKHESSNAMHKIVRGLASGVRGSRVEEASAFEAITVRDTPAALATMARAIAELDVPRPDVETEIHIVIAAHEGDAAAPAELTAALEEVRRTMGFSAFYRAARITQRARSGSWSFSSGVAELAPPVVDAAASTTYKCGFRPSVAREGASRTIRLRELGCDVDSKQLGNVDIDTEVTLKEGQTIVLGTAAIKGRALILLVSVKIR